jgi:hypothetical protein
MLDDASISSVAKNDQEINPVTDYVVSLYTQHDFKTWEDEARLEIVRGPKAVGLSAGKFLNNIESFTKFVVDVKKIEHLPFNKALEVVESMLFDLKNKPKIDDTVVDAVSLNNENWDYKNILIETESQYIYMCRSSTA